MTWVFGTATKFFGTAICVADIQVTLANGKTIDCLQKLYPLEQNVVAGFSGNVEAGFAMLAELQRFVRRVAADSGQPADVRKVLEGFPEQARSTYGGLSPAMHRGGCDLLVAGGSLVPDRIYNSEPHVARFAAPDFMTEGVPRGTWGSIGSGSVVEGYRRELERLTTDEARPLLTMEANNPGGYAER